jgi:hypothetical protein
MLREIRQDLACPGCGYNLRGLAGDVVNCPECGQSCDVAKLVKWNWAGSLHRAPGLNTLAWPAIWLVMGSVTIGCLLARALRLFDALVYGHGWRLTLLVFTVLCTAAILPVWMWLMYRAWRNWRGVGGLGLALLAHAIVGAFVVGPLCAGTCPWWWKRNPAATLGVVLVGVFFCWAGYQGYRYLAEQCIRRYLRGGR